MLTLSWVFPRYSFNLKRSIEWDSGEVLGPLRGGVLWKEVLGSLGKGNHETPGIFFSFGSFVSWIPASSLAAMHCTVFVLQCLRLKGKGKLKAGTSGSTSSNNPSLQKNCLSQVFCSSVRSNYHRQYHHGIRLPDHVETVWELVYERHLEKFGEIG